MTKVEAMLDPSDEEELESAVTSCLEWMIIKKARPSPTPAHIYRCTGDPTFHCMMLVPSVGGNMAGACGMAIITSSDSYVGKDYDTDITLRPSLNNKGWVMTRFTTSIMVPSTCDIGGHDNREQAMEEYLHIMTNFLQGPATHLTTNIR